MAFFEDLSPYCYHESGVRPDTQNIGWLEAKKPFPTATVSGAFLKQLWQFCKIPVVQTRGFHVCDLCDMPAEVIPTLEFEGEVLKLGSAEIRVFGGSGVIYAAPNLIFHYVKDHTYRPPQEFIDAVIAGPGPKTTEYRDQLRALSFSK
jgi:hypothetical protein